MNSLSITRILSVLVVVLLPFWALPILPGTFRPISMFLCFPLGLLFILSAFAHDRLSKPDIVLLVFFALSLMLSAIQFVFLGGSSTNYIIGNILFFLGVFGYFGFKYCLNQIGFDAFMRYLRLSTYIIVIIGWVDVFGWLGLIPELLRESINFIVAGKSSSRIILTASEPAWASRLSICFLPFAYYFWSAHKTFVILVSLISLVVFFILAFSLSGILVLFAAMGLFIISKLSFKVLFNVTVIAAVFFTGLFFTFQKMKEGGGYFVTRFDKVASIESIESVMTLEALAAIDGSALIRLGYPWIALQVAIEKPLGVGIGRYPEYFNEKVKQYGKIVTNDPAVAEHIEKKNADQRSYYIKVYTDTGFFAVLLIIFYAMVHKRLKLLSQRVDYHILCPVLLVSMYVCYGNMVQFASFIFPFYWLAPAIITFLYENNESAL